MCPAPSIATTKTAVLLHTADASETTPCRQRYSQEADMTSSLTSENLRGKTFVSELTAKLHVR